jgi:hypothetical protein
MRNEGDLSTEDLAQQGGGTSPAAAEHRDGGIDTARAAGEQRAGAEGRLADDRTSADRTDGDDADRSAGGTSTAQDQPVAGATGVSDREATAGTSGPQSRADGGGGDVALLDPADEERFRQRWGDVQARFVDDPQEAVRTADGLVAELMQSLAQAFSGHKGRLESQWQQGGNPDTEELRQALQRYRSFFNRLLST